MTLIAAMTGQGLPVLMGDLLLSSPKRVAQATTNVPTIGDVAELFAESQRVPTGLCQKLCILDDRLAIGWSGGHMAARTVMNELKAHLASGRATPEELEALLGGMEEIRRGQVDLVGLLVHDDRVLSFGSRRARLFNSSYGTVRAAGTGASALESLANSMKLTRMSESTNPLIAPILAFVGMSGGMIAEELRTAKSLQNYYGGGFELVTYNRGRLEKLDDITYVFWTANEETDGWNISPPRAVIKLSYKSDILIIRSVKLQAGTPMNQQVTSDVFYPISPVYRTIREEEITADWLPDLNSTVVCHTVTMFGQGGTVQQYLRTDYGTEVENTIRFEHDGWRLKALEIHGRLWHSLAEGILRGTT